jgi:hypothetical protein
MIGVRYLLFIAVQYCRNAAVPADVDGPIDREAQRGQIDRLDEVVERPAPYRLDRRLSRAKAVMMMTGTLGSIS